MTSTSKEDDVSIKPMSSVGLGPVSANTTTMSWFGSLEPFNEGQTTWDSYVERMDEFFSINNVPDDKKHSFLLMFIGQKCYDTLRDICQPDKPARKSYAQLVELMKNHLQPKPSVLSERYKFHKITQGHGQSISDFVLSLKRAAQDCDFENRDISLRDQFVSGLVSDNLKKRLFTESDLTFKKAVEISLSWESAEHDVAVVHVSTSQPSMNYCGPSKNFQKKRPGRQSEGNFSTSGRFNGNQGQQPRPNVNHQGFRPKPDVKSNGNLGQQCTCCGRTNHVKSKCRYLNYSCNFCKVKGHLNAVCPKRKFSRPKYNARHNNIDASVNDDNLVASDVVEQVSLEDRFNNCMYLNNDDEGIFNVCEQVSDFDRVNSLHKQKSSLSLSKNEAPFMVNVEIENKSVKMEIDTGSPISAISENVFREYFSHRKLNKNELSLKSYDGSVLNPLGYVKVSAKYNDCTKLLDLYVFANGGLPILGRNWIKELDISLSFNKVYDSDVEQLCNDFPNVFSGRLGTFTKRKISLKVKPDTIPIYCKPRPVPFALLGKVEEEIDNLVKLGILEPIDISDWGTPIVAVSKPDGTVRVCGDFSVTINPNLQVERYPLPKIEFLLAKLSGSSYFSKLDLRHAYHQLLLDDESKKLTTISTTKGLFCYTRIPYGITSGPYIFQKVIDLTLLNLGNVPVAVFQDDVIIGGKNKDDHLRNVRTVLQRLNDFGFSVKKEKCEFFKDSVSYLGYFINKDGTHTDQSKVKAVMNAPVPTNVSELKAFLGLVNFYGRFLKNLADALHPLYKLLSKNTDWSWSEECNDAFESVKKMLTQAPCLAYYDPNLPVQLACDASSYGLGCVLSCVFPDGNERPIAYASRVLTQSERNFSQIEKEALSIIYGVKKFYHYLYARHFTLLTDHQPLLTIFGKKKGIPQMAANRLQRWAIFLSGFDFTIQYVKSSKHSNADCLSRLPIPVNCSNDDDFDDFDYLKFIQTTCFPISAKTVGNETVKDSILSKVLDYTLHGWPSQLDITNEMRPYFLKRNELSVEDNCVLWGYRIVIPNSLQSNLLNELHSTHLGVVKMKSMARSTFWWPNVDSDVEQVATSCEFCEGARKSPPKHVLCNWNIPHGPWERVHMDFFGPVNNQMYLLVIDAYSKFLEIVPMRSITASQTIGQLREIFSRFGLPYSVVTDNGPTWTSAEFATFVQLNGIKHNMTAPYHPASNGAAERAVQTVKKGIYIALRQGKDVNISIVRFLFDYRNTSHCSTCKSPSELMFGRKLRSKFDLLRPNRLEKINSSLTKQTEFFSGHRNTSFSENQLVLVKDYRTSQASNWAKANIVKVLSPVSYLVRLHNSNVLWKRHCDQILPVRENLNLDISKAKLTTSFENDKLRSNVDVVQKPNYDVSSPKVECVSKRRSLLISPSPTKVCSPSVSESRVSPQVHVSPNQIVFPVDVSDKPSDSIDTTPIRSSAERRYPIRSRKPKNIFDL